MTTSPPRICVLGSVNLDLVIQTPRFPKPGETLLGGPFETFAGGTGANQAVAAARLGAHVDFLGCVGNDDGGRLARKAFEDAGMNCDGLDTRVGEHTGVGLITVNPEGENHIVVAPGANYAMTPAWVAEHAATIRASQTLLLQLEVPIKVNQAAARIAFDCGVPVVLNAAPAASLPAEFLACVHTLIVNQHEFDSLERLHVPRLIVTLGQDGAVCWDQDMTGKRRETRQASFPIEPVDTTAAGDAFCAATTVAALENDHPAEFLSFGAAAGALACTVAGAIPALPYRAQVDALRATVLRDD